MGQKWDWGLHLDKSPRRLLLGGVPSVESCLVRSMQQIRRPWESIPGSEHGMCKGPEAGRSLCVGGLESQRG